MAIKIKNMFEMGSKAFGLSNESNRFYLVIVALLIIFAYIPTLQYDYVSRDQGRALEHSLIYSPLTKAHKCFASRIDFDLRSGRPLCSIGECLEHALVGKISDFSTTRPLVLALVIFTAFCVGMALSPSMGGVVNGTAIGALFVLSPGYAFMYYLGLNGAMNLIAMILATISYLFICQAIIDNFNKNKLLLSSALFLIACMIYPAWAFLVFIFSLIDFMFCTKFEQNVKFKHLIIKLSFFAAIAIIYYLIIKLIIIFLPPTNINNYEFSANFNPIYLSKRFLVAVLFYIGQPPLNTLYSSLNILNIIFLLLVIVIGTFLFFRNNNYKLIKTIFSFLYIAFICALLIFVSTAPWLVSKMPQLGNRYFISFSLLMCTLIGWVIFIVSNKLFPTKKYISTILLIFIILLPASAIQNKRTAIEVGIWGSEIEAMRLVVHKWIDEYSFTKQRYVVVVKPKRPRPLFYDRVLNNVTHGGSFRIPEDPLYYYKILSEFIEKKSDNDLIGARLDRVLKFAGYGDSLEFNEDPSHYFQVFLALIKEECDRYHPLSLMMFHNLSFAQERAEQILDYSHLNIVFTVIDQGDHIKTKHEVLETNFSLITNSPEPLIIDREMHNY